MSILRLGATKQYSDNWTNIFGGGGRKTAAKKATTTAAKKSPKKSSKGVAKTRGKKRSGR
jgi:hypothetical protein